MAQDGCIIGVDLGGTKVLSAVIDDQGQVLGRAKERTQSQKTDGGVFEAIEASIRGAVAAAEVGWDCIAGIGVGAPGPLDPERGIVLIAPNMALRNYPLGPNLTQAFGCPAFVNNDANMGVFGEWKMGAGRGVSSLMGVFVGTGIGGGLILDGRLYEGFTRSAGEIGHVLAQVDGPRCGCGNRGCVETLASRKAISNMLYRAIEKGDKSILSKKFKGDPPSVRSKALAKAYAAGDELTVRVLDKSARILGMSIGSNINILAPEMVILGGGFIDALGTAYVERVAEAAREWTFEVNREAVRIVSAELADDAIIHGAAAYARTRLDEIQQAD